MSLGTIQESDRNVYEYGYQLMIEAFINVVISLLLGAVLGCFKEVVFFLIVFMPLRSFCGGYHAAKTWQCTVLSNLVVLLVIVVSKVSLLAGIITPVTGCGVYILGRDYYTDRSLNVMKRRAQYCRFGIIELDPGLAPDTIYDIRTIDDTDPDEYQSVVDIWRTQVVSDAREELRERNGVMPEGCSDYFTGWFSEEDWMESCITDEERIACTEQLDKDKQWFMKRYH